jgi:hypothetical protein
MGLRKNQDQYWMCIIGPVKGKELPDGADSPPRVASINAIIKMIGRHPEMCYSDWGISEKIMNEITQVWVKDI